MVCDNKAMTQVVSSTDVVARGYDQMAAAYLSERAALKSGKYVQKLLTLLPKRAQILDLGCGAGVPIDDLFLKKGHQVTGIDISPVMIARARRACPEGDYLVGDIQGLQPGAYQVDAVVSFYALFHLPRARHLAELQGVHEHLEGLGADGQPIGLVLRIDHLGDVLRRHRHRSCTSC